MEHFKGECTDLQLYWSQALKNTLTTTEPISSAKERLTTTVLIYCAMEHLKGERTDLQLCWSLQQPWNSHLGALAGVLDWA